MTSVRKEFRTLTHVDKAMFAPYLPITDQDVSQWKSLLSVKPFVIGDDVNRMYEYVNVIARYSNMEKGEDLGICTLIMAELQGRQADLRLSVDVEEISAEANNRAIAHVLYLRAFHKLEFINGNDDGGILTSNLIDAAVNIRSQFQTAPELVDLGVKMVEYIAQRVLD